ncbi:HNH endonuclease [Shewanella sp. AS1]|uniref:HNH endonuclease n=1 Tax=Shewanella sp. AS1 TaxID=2907626 RepID=UPI001F2DB246|nr:HNH endonuclease [Shewanella sp. AS1]MCE9679343.1 HNH endonuclease [Shewanella sp. AS1]
MFSVIFDGDNRRTKTFKTLKGAQRAIWKWLKANEQHLGYSATLIGPGIETAVFQDAAMLPFEEQKPIDFLQTGAWVNLKHLAYKRYGNHCACCGKSPKEGVVLHVDHIKPRSLYPELERDINNLQILCRDCNLGKSNLSEMQWR